MWDLETTKHAKYSKRALRAGLPAWREKPEGYALEHNVLEKTQNDTEKSTACGCGCATMESDSFRVTSQKFIIRY